LVQKFTLQVAVAVSLLTILVHYIIPVLTAIFPLIITITVVCNYLFWAYHGMAGDYREVLCVLTAITAIAFILMAL